MGQDMTVALVRYDAARRALAEAHDVDEVKDIRDKAQAMAAYARQAKDTELVEWATEIKVRAERRAGELLREMAEHGERAGDGKPSRGATVSAPTVAALGLNRSQVSRWQKLAAVPEDQFERAVAAAKEVAGEVTTAALLRIHDGKPHVAYNAGESEWYTPAVYIAAAREAIGTIDLDPASTTEANSVVCAAHFYNATEDGLKHPWRGRVWLNPPYSSEMVGLFTAKLAGEYAAGRTIAGIALVNNATETDWFQSLARQASALCFPRGRVKFWAPGRVAAPLQGQALLYLGNDPTRFAHAFASFGLTVANL
jgi:phage N-6-adenine-methyltransferase